MNSEARTRYLPVALLLLAVAGCRSSAPPEPVEPPAPVEPPEVIEPPPSAIHAPVRLEDNPFPSQTLSSKPIASTPRGVLFSMESSTRSSELWRSDGTQAGTFPLGMGPTPGLDADTHAAGFVLGGEDGRLRLWQLRDDGRILSSVMAAPAEVRKLGGRYLALSQSALVALTEDGTQEVLAELSSGLRWPRFVALVAGRWFLVDGAKRLWVTDGTPAGTRLVYAFPYESEIFQGAAAGSRLVLLVGFSSSSFGGPQPWASDGTPEGTFQIEQLGKYAISTSGTPLLSTGSSVVFEATDSTTGFELRATDGTPGSLRTLTGLCEPPGCSANFQLLAQAGAFAFFSARDSAGPGLWRTDGTPEGTFRLAQGSVSEAVTVDGVAYLAGDKLWRTDGSVEGTVVLDTDRVNSLGQPVDGAVPYLAGGTLRIARGTVTRVLTGVLPVTQILGRTPSRAWVLFLVPGSLLSVDEDTEAQTVLPAPPTASGTRPNRLTAAQDTLYFRGSNSQGLVDLRASEGSAESIRTVALGQPRTCTECVTRPEPNPMAAIGETFFFQTAPGALAAIPAGGAQTEIHPPSWCAAQPAVPFHGRLLFYGRATSGGVNALWAAEADGSRAAELFAFPPGPGQFGYRYPFWFEVSGDTVFIWVSTSTFSTDELWTYDGAGGGRLVATYPFTGAPAHALSPHGILFACQSVDLGLELCASDGTPEGTGLLADLWPGAKGSAPGDVVRFGDHVYFTADDGVHGRELWVSDGTREGTRLAFDLLPGAESSKPGYLAVGKTQLYFRAWTPELGAELWSLGLEGPPVALTDTMPGERNGLPLRALAVRDGGDWLVFAARTPENGEELWFSDGTREGTRLLADALPGPQSSAPFELQLSTSHIYFGARDATHGVVPWAIGFERAPSSVHRE